MTQKLYYIDAYIKEFDAKVLECVKSDNLYDVVLDKTAFFPEEGGQYSDTGFIGEAQVIKVFEKGLEIHHLCDKPVNGDVRGVLNFDERYEKMQCHSAEHILSGLFYKNYGVHNVGFHLGKDDVTMDISRPLSREEIDRVEQISNEIVYKNVKITTEFPAAGELEKLQYRSKLDLKENVRIVNIGEYDSCACCAPHVNFTGEIGLIKILESEKLRGGMRLHISAGKRANRIFSKLYNNALKISSMLSVPRDEIPSGVENILNSLTKTKAEYENFRLATFLKQVENFAPTDKNTVLYFENASVNELREVANALLEKVEGYVVLLCGQDGNLQYVIACRNQDLSSSIKEINQTLNGRGGGRGVMAQGAFQATVKEVNEYFSK